MSPTAQERYDEFVRSLIWPQLKQAGFRRSKATFRRAVGPNWEIINLQKSAYSDADDIRFTVNVGVGIERLRTGSWDWGEGKQPSIGDCRFQRRLGELMVGEDVWWDLRPDTDLNVLSESLGEALRRYGLPWLRERSSDELLRDTLLAEISSLYDHELTFLAELIEFIGPPSALAAVKREQARRSAVARHS